MSQRTDPSTLPGGSRRNALTSASAFLAVASSILLQALPGLAQAPAGPPSTPRDNVREVIHGLEIVDPYRWLEDQESPETRAWIAAQNAYTHAHLDALPRRQPIADRLAELMKIDRVSPLTERQGRFFLWKKRAEDDLWIL